ncbi:exo-alpha-sialidase [Curtobacterium sp. MCBD17_032]|uniref:sialidase family protein n=1 Tax=Curtobacterium sp. MCBD17_032 TaxID=2175659 RepID=UPI000DAA5E62|nr:exo-alpha-sialidase [Curtobacterium sp. MCBD17_032]PZE86951.1 glycosyl hydrolase [Curtobacterium sp. MCBD17_032]
MSDFDGLLRARSDGGAEALLPTPTVQCHAANLAFLPGGDLACVWFGGTQEGVSDISVHLSRLPAGTDRWLDPVQLSSDSARSEQNPILFTAPDGAVWLLYTAQIAGNQDTSEVRRRTSLDGGVTWSDPTALLGDDAPVGVFVRQTPVVLESGRILLPVFNCRTVPGEKWVGNDDTASVWYSDDTGETWSEVAVPESSGCVHMDIVPREDGVLWACFRSRWADHVYESSSTDGGMTWEPCRPIDLPNNNSSIQARALDDGRIAMVMNHASKDDATSRRVSLYDEIDDDGLAADAADGVPPVAEPSLDADGPSAFWGAPRAPMTLVVSSPDGRSWPTAYDIENGDGYCLSNNSRDGINRELSYPSVLPDPAGGLHIAYTWHRKSIKHVYLPADVLATIVSTPSTSAGPALSAKEQRA